MSCWSMGLGRLPGVLMYPGVAFCRPSKMREQGSAAAAWDGAAVAMHLRVHPAAPRAAGLADMHLRAEA